jgi:predicted nucleic acid-binding protein
VIVLDTNVLSELIRSEPDEGVVRWLDARDATAVATTSVTAAEVFYDVARLPAGRRKKQLSAGHPISVADSGNLPQAGGYARHTQRPRF